MKTSNGKTIKKFKLFREYNDLVIFGNSIGDALKRHGEIRPEYTSSFFLKKFITEENVSGSKRGETCFRRAIIETDTGKIKKIDFTEIKIDIAKSK